MKAQGWGKSDVTIAARHQSGGSEAAPCLNAAELCLIAAALCSPIEHGGGFGSSVTEVDCASWSQLSVISREMTDQDQLLS